MGTRSDVGSQRLKGKPRLCPERDIGTGLTLPCYEHMLENLAELTKMRQQLRESAEKLVGEAETAPNAPGAFANVKIACECNLLARSIEILTKELLNAERSHGTC